MYVIMDAPHNCCRPSTRRWMDMTDSSTMPGGGTALCVRVLRVQQGPHGDTVDPTGTVRHTTSWRNGLQGQTDHRDRQAHIDHHHDGLRTIHASGSACRQCKRGGLDDARRSRSGRANGQVRPGGTLPSRKYSYGTHALSRRRKASPQAAPEQRRSGERAWVQRNTNDERHGVKQRQQQCTFVHIFCARRL